MSLTVLNFPLKGENAPNNKLVAGVMGIRSRGNGLAQAIVELDGIELGYVCDVDDEYLNERTKELGGKQGKTPKAFKDVRKLLEQKDLDILFIAAPDHWHAPAAIMALQAGKHVYVEKPCGHNPREGELIVQAQRKYGKLVQMGNQQRSAPESILAMKEIKEGVIGEPYFAKAWYASKRGPIGTGKVTAVKPGLDYDLWQGPAPRTPYRDNIHPYNWHWFWRWGTGEICNNGTHEVDVCRWALGVDYPVRVTSSGGRFHFDDDWEFYDTQVANFDFEGNKSITWEGRSCNDKLIEKRGRGAAIHGTEGTIILDRNGYELFDLGEKLVKQVRAGENSDGLDRVGMGGGMTHAHIQNLMSGIKDGQPLNAPIDQGAISVLLCHLGNIAQKTGRVLNCNTKDGHIVNDPEAMKMWGRTYETGWEPSI